MALSVVQSLLGFAVSISSNPVTSGNFSSTSGHLLVVGIRVGASLTISSVKNAAGASFTPLAATTSGALSTQFFYLNNITGNATDSITVQFSSNTGTTTACWIWEISGQSTTSPSDVATGGTNSGTSPITSNSFSTAVANEIILAFATENATGTCDFSNQSGYSLDTTPGSPTVGTASGFIGAQHLIVSSLQSNVTSDMTFTGVVPTAGLISVASFEAAAASTFSISGNAGIAGANVAYSGTASGNVTADGSGNYTISGLSNGSYTITPSLIGYTFSPTSANETVSGSNITGVNFTATQQTVATPTFSPVAGTYSSTQSVTISTTTPGASIFYTTDGSTPTTGSTPYTTPVPVASSLTLKALATASGFINSAVGSAIYVISGTGSAFSVTDSRVSPFGPNNATLVNGTETYTQTPNCSLRWWFDTSFNHTQCTPEDCRAAGAPVASGTYPQNSRVKGG
jgi:hypothetical protein